jgi:hypothetical protein
VNYFEFIQKRSSKLSFEEVGETWSDVGRGYSKCRANTLTNVPAIDEGEILMGSFEKFTFKVNKESWGICVTIVRG